MRRLGLGMSRMGGPDIMGRGWCSHTLNVEAAYVVSWYCSSLPLYSSVNGNGAVVGLAGGRALAGQEQVLAVSDPLPALWWVGGDALPALWCLALLVWLGFAVFSSR